MTNRASAGVARSEFGTLPSGQPVDAFTLTTRSGITMRCIGYGAIITSLELPDREGRREDVVLGHDRLAGYLASSPYFGAVIGRYANRIAHGRFTLDGVTHQLATNDGEHHLHGGVHGFDKVVWHAEPFERDADVGVRFSYESRDGEEGYPGALSAVVEYRLTEAGELHVTYRATASRATPVNLTQHTYWNLAGARAATILDHELAIDADSFLPIDATLIPTGEHRPVEDTPFDFREPMAVGRRIGEPEAQLAHAGGYDHTFVLRAASSAGLQHAARLHDPVSGRTVDIATSEPGIQLYSGNFLDGSIRGKEGRVYQHRGGLCLETHHFPDSPNQPSFPSTILLPGETYASTTIYRFSVGR